MINLIFCIYVVQNVHYSTMSIIIFWTVALHQYEMVRHQRRWDFCKCSHWKSLLKSVCCLYWCKLKFCNMTGLNDLLVLQKQNSHSFWHWPLGSGPRLTTTSSFSKVRIRICDLIFQNWTSLKLILISKNTILQANLQNLKKNVKLECLCFSTIIE